MAAEGQSAAEDTGGRSSFGVATAADPTYVEGKLHRLSLTLGGYLRVIAEAGANVIGKVTTDRTTPGTTNSVAPITGQDGVAAGAGAVGATVQRVTLASDDPAVAALGATTGVKVITDANGTMQQYLRGLVTFFANSLGAGTAANAERVVQATDDTIHGPVTETAPATDTASSGLNGRLQRIAQRLTTLITAVGTLVYDSFGALRVNTEGGKATYRSGTSTVVMTADGVFLQLQGSGTKTVRITKVAFSGALTTSATVICSLFRATGAVTTPAGTITTAISKLDSNNATATAVVTAYTTSVLAASATRVAYGRAQAASATVPVVPYTIDFGTRNSQTFVLRGTGEFFQLNISTASYTGASFDCDIEWTEE